MTFYGQLDRALWMGLRRGFSPWFLHYRRFYPGARFYVRLLWLSWDKFKCGTGQDRQNRLRDDCVRREDQCIEFDRATLPQYPNPLHALTVFVCVHNFCLRQEVIEVVVGRQPDTVLLLQEIAGRGERPRFAWTALSFPA